MYYKQSTKDIKMVIMSFDDVMFDLTKLRYNYYRRLCKLYNVTLDKKSFLERQGSCRTMFADSPIDPALLNTENMIHKIETDLLAYCQMYGLKHKDGLVELMELFRQKKIPCVVTSTHPKKYTEPLLKLAALYHQPTEMIYDEQDMPCLPDKAYYQNILSRYGLKSQEVLLIASHMAAVRAANDLRMNVVAVPGLEEPSKEMEIRCLKVANSLLDVINIILEGRIAPLSDQYLLIRYDGSTQDLYQNYRHIHDRFRQDPEVLAVIETIYQTEFSRAQKAEVEVQLKKQEASEKHETAQKEVSVLNSLEEALNHEEEEMITAINDAIAAQKEETSPSQEQKVNPLADLSETDPSLTLDALPVDEATIEFTPSDNDELAKMINEVAPEQPKKEPQSTTQIFTKEELKALGIKEKDLQDGSELDDENEEEGQTIHLWVNFIVNMGYALMDAIFICIIIGILMVGFQDWIAQPQQPLRFISYLLYAFSDAAVYLFGSFTHSITSFFNTSDMFDGFLAVILLSALIIWIILDIIAIIRKIRTKQV